MRMSKLGIKTRKERGNEETLSQEILLQSTQLKRHSSGIYGMGTLLVKARNNIIDVVRKNLNKYECAEVSLPIVQPRILWDESGRWDTYSKSKTMFTFQGRNEEWYCLAPTGEEIVFDFIKNNIKSYKDLPINIYQIGLKFRDELRIHGGLMRSKEFMMKDGYSFHASSEDMVREYARMRECYKQIFKELGLKVTPVKAVSAEMGGKVSEEFMCFCDIGEDKALTNEDKSIALNTEILDYPDLIEDFKKANPTIDFHKLTESRCIELGHIFQLGTFYSQKMGGYFTDANGKNQPLYMGCYGIGINRTLGAICEVNCDNDGLCWPVSIAPFKCDIVYLNDKKDFAEEIYNKITQAGIDCVIDDRETVTFGSKIKDAKLLGFPYLIIIGKNCNNNEIEIEVRKTNEKLFVNCEQLISTLK